MRIKIILLHITLIFLYASVYGQSTRIDLGPDEIAQNQAFTITITVENEKFENYSGFPEIKGFVKRGTSSSSSTNFINGQRSSSQSIIQNYAPTAEGEFILPAFIIKVNGKPVKSGGQRIKVGPARQQQRRRNDPFGNDPFQDLFGRRNQPQEFVDIEADAFLAVTTDKDEIYSGEGFTITVALFVSKKNRAEMYFHELNEQLSDIVEKIKPANCWEEKFNITNIVGEPIKLKGQQYDMHKIFQATYYPINDDNINIPSISLVLNKYNRAKNPSFFGRGGKQELVTFNSKPKTVNVKNLPSHPLKDKVSVGDYRLEEKISSQELNTGESFNYAFNIVGEGNISAITEPNLESDSNFDLYPPNIRQDVRRSNGVVKGIKAFNIYGIPNEPGTFDMSKYFSWIYFNTEKEAYDTLSSTMVLNVKGESKMNEYILSNDMGSFYDTMEFKDNKLYALSENETTKTFANVLILLMLVASAFVIFKK